MNNILYGDGIHDDTVAIQELIDTSGCELRLPAPKECYLISKPLELPSNFKLSLPRFAKIRLAENSNCVMLKNKTIYLDKADKRTNIWSFNDTYSPDYPCENIEVEGGIWDFNNIEQALNPMFYQKEDGELAPMSTLPIEERPYIFDEHGMAYAGFGFLFYNVKNLRISSMTLKDPVTFAVVLDTVSYFTVDNITFDFNYGKVKAYNMDGIHLNGNCHFGTIENLKGACHDDLVALNADEGSSGPITNVTIKGIYAEVCHSAVRLLSAKEPVKNVRISDVYGSYYQYCIGITNYYYLPGVKGLFDGLVIDNVCVSKANRLPVFNQAGNTVFPVIFVDTELDIKTLRVSNVHYREYDAPFASVLGISKDSKIESLYLDHITAENYTEKEGKPLLENLGNVENVYANEIYENGKKIAL